MNLGKLESLERRLGAIDETEIADEIEALRDELRTFRREHKMFRERAHAAVDATIAEAGDAAGHFLDSIATVTGPLTLTHPPGSPEPPVLRAAHLLALTRPEFAKAWHVAVDRSEAFSVLTVAEFEKRSSKLEGELRAREVELERRPIVAERMEGELALSLLEKRL